MVTTETPSPLAPVEAGQGEREALERAWDSYWNKSAKDFDPTAEEMFAAGWKAALSQGNGEAVGWQVRVLDDGDWQQCSKEAFDRYAGKSEDYEYRALFTAPPSPPEGVREALDASRLWKFLVEAGQVTQTKALVPVVIISQESLRAAFHKFTTIPSRGLIEAAWRFGIENAPKEADWILVCGPKWNGPSLAYFSDSQNEDCWIEMPGGERLDETADRWMLVPSWETPTHPLRKGRRRVSALSPEEIGRKFSQRWYEAEPGTPYHMIAELIAAAIREDRAEQVSDAEIETAREIFTKRRCHCPECVRAALEAARKVRAEA